MTTIANRWTVLPRNTKLALYGLGIGILGLIIQWIADPAKFPGFPPGIAVIAVIALLVVVGVRWWWTPLLATMIALLIIVGGLLGQDLIDNLTTGSAGTVAGNVVLCLGLVFAAITGVLAALEARRAARLERTDA
ncbi:hypothetical protein [Nocardia brasiliensis]